MLEKFKSLDRFTRILLIACLVFMILSVTLGFITVFHPGNDEADPKPVLTTVDSSSTTVTTTGTTTSVTTTVTTATTEDVTSETEEVTTTTAEPVKETKPVVAKKETRANERQEETVEVQSTKPPAEKPVSKPVKTESPSKTEVYYPKEQSVPNEYDTYDPCIAYKNSEFYAETICDSTEIYTWPTNYCVALAKLKPGTKVRIYDMSEYWCSVSVADGSGVSGFVRRSSLKMIGESDMEEYPDRSVEKCVVADETSLYPAPDITDDVITVICFNERLTILREGRYWCYCEYKTETGSVLTGYVLSYDIY